MKRAVQCNGTSLPHVKGCAFIVNGKTILNVLQAEQYIMTLIWGVPP